MTTENVPVIAEPTPYHKWTHDGTKVRILKCVDKDRKAHNGFQWPESGSVVPEKWVPDAECGNGLHGWAWGLAFGDGKEPSYQDCLWIVFEADPADVIQIDGGKVKTAKGNVIYCGSLSRAVELVLPGQIAWTQYICPAKILTTVGISGAASNSGYSGAASNSGISGAASNSGDRGAASNSGYSGAASNSGISGAASNSGDRGAASNSGYRGAASNSGYSGAASNSGYSGAASNSGDRGAASNSGDRGIAASTGEYSTVESIASGLIAVTATTVYWRIRTGSVLCQRTASGAWLLLADEFSQFKDGDLVQVTDGQLSKV